MGKVGSVDCVGFLVGGTGACVLLDEAGSFLSGGEDRVWWCVLGCLLTYYDFRHLSANGWGCVPVLLVVWHRVSSTLPSAYRLPEGICSSPRQDGVKGAADLAALAHSGPGEGRVRNVG